MQPRQGRPLTDPPPGWVTVATAAERRGVSYSVAYRHVRQGLVGSRQLDNGVILVDEGDLHKIAKHEPPADRTRIAVALAPNARRHAAWSAAASAAGTTVTGLAGKLLDQAAGWVDE